MITGHRGIPRTVVAALAAAGALTVTALPVHAQPPVSPTLQTTVSGNSVVTHLDSATFDLARDQRTVRIIDAHGQLLETLPLTFQVNDRPFTIGKQISDDQRTLMLTPDLAAVHRAGLEPVASPMEEQLALNQLSVDLGRQLGIGGLAGAVVGAAVGAVLGLGSCLVVGPACLATIPAAIAAFAAGGGVAGTLIGGGSALADSGWKYLLTLQAPPGRSPYAGQDGVLANDGTGVPDANLRLPSGSASGLKSGSSSGSGG
ncbi:hypothetical protein [Nocardia australiensis]|uniref:hypothetical protein n=1 Tax=Nocardia australiensis TaxID=2887191 RepID=UPI001D133286|nr:hypothetical protein [Nocardia australiensis]